MLQIKILRGLPGSGKSRLCQSTGAVSVSADHYVDYENFCPSQIPRAHKACMRRFVELVLAGEPTIFVDNTNISVAECAPYVAIGEAHGYSVEIVTIPCDVDTSKARNVHDVPAFVIERMAESLPKEEKRFPPWWNHRKLG